VLLRRLEPADFDTVMALHGTLSERDRYFKVLHDASPSA
jgi:hypothetical protein